jgi:hypothetical protein
VKVASGEAHDGLDPGPEPAGAAQAPTACLVIHCGRGAAPSALQRTFPRFAGWLIGRKSERRCRSLELAVHDLEGHPVGNFEPAGCETRLQLTAGTYVVVASNGTGRRTYTMTLSAGARFDLYVDALEPPGRWPSAPA